MSDLLVIAAVAFLYAYASSHVCHGASLAQAHHPSLHAGLLPYQTLRQTATGPLGAFYHQADPLTAAVAVKVRVEVVLAIDADDVTTS